MIYEVVNILPTKKIRFKTSTLRSDVYIVVKGTIDLSAAATNENDKAEEDVVFLIMVHLGCEYQKLLTY